MKKIFFFLAAMALAITANAKVTTISPDAENDALRLAVHYAEDGDIIEMTEGTYVQCNNGYVDFKGKSVTVKAAEGANVVLQLQVPITLTNGGKATLQGIKIDASRLTELADWYEHVVYPTDATEGKELIMDGCELYDFNMNKSAIYSKADNKLDLCRINNCYFHDVEKSCLFFEGTSIAELSVTNSTFANNIAKVTGSYYAGIIDVRNAAAKVTVDHCTFYNCLLMNTDYAAITMKGPQAANVVISNNIFMLPEAIDGHRAIRESVEATNCMTFNYVKDNGGIHSSVTKTNCQLNVDPMFVDAANGDFALADGSPALTAGTDGKAIGDPRWNVVAEPEPTTETVYFVNALNWTGTINAYAWTTDPNAAWPGAAATKEAEQIGGYDVYSYTAEAGKYANVIFNGTGGQTADLKWTAGKYYVLDGWYTKEEAEAKLVTPIVDEVVYFVNNKNWSKVNAYAWDPANAAWPGAAATKEAEQIAGFDVYSYSAAPGTYQKVIFNDGGSNQTSDMVWTAGKYIVNNQWYTKEEAEAALAAPVVTTWTMVGDKALFGTDWDLNATANDLVKQEDGSWVLTLTNKTLAAKSYEYKAAKDRSWTTTVPGGDNAKLTISKAGQYDVTFTLNAAATSVTAKATYIPAKYNVTVTAENGTVEGAGEYEEGTTATLTATANEGYEFVNWTVGEEVVSTENPYTFTVTADIALVANFQATEPVVELPAASVRAWAYDLALAVEGEQYTFSYKATTAALATLIFTDGEGVELATVELGRVEAGANSVVLAKSELPAGKKVNWAVKLEAGAIANFVELTDASKGIYNFYLPQGVAVDNNPESSTFGNIYVAAATNGASDGSSDRADTQKRGIFIYDQELNELNPTSNVGIIPSNVTLGSADRQAMKRLVIDPTTNNVAFVHNANPIAIWAVPAENVAGEATNLIADLGFTAAQAVCFDENGDLYVLVSPGYPSKGSLYKVVDGEKKALFEESSRFGNADVAMASDGRGGIWIAQNRGQLDTYNQLTHLNAAGEIDFELNSANPHNFTSMNTARGTIAYNPKEDVLALSIGTGSSIGASLYSVVYDAETGVPSLTYIAATPVMGKNVDGLAFDYAGDLYGLSANRERLYKFAVPTETNVCTTPAASQYAFQNIEYDTMEITMTNLEVAEMGGYLVLTASDEMETGLNVMLALNEDGSVSEMSYASIISGWMETELPIVEGNITKTYSEELATDVYSGLVVVEYNEGYLGLDLTMYYVAPEYTDIVITNATVTEDVRDLGWGDETYTVLKLESTWSDGVETYPVLVEVNDYDLSVVEGTAVVSVTIGGWGDEDPWLGSAEGEMAYTIVDGVITLTGKLDNPSAWPAPVYWNLTISGSLSQGPGTALDNVDVEAKTIKMIKNGQLIIIKNGVQYNVQGQVIK